jgi:hypothetical protein
VQRTCLGNENIFNIYKLKCFPIVISYLQILFKLGFGIYYLNNEDKIKLINFDLISSDLNQDAHAVVRGFRLLREQTFFKEIDQKEYVVWCDAGKHFRNNELLGYLLIELARDKIHGLKHFSLYFKTCFKIKTFYKRLVSLNFFAEKHGKNSRDSHFSNLTRFIKAESLVRKLVCTQDIVDAINSRQDASNLNNSGITQFKPYLI